ncbi:MULTISPECIES: YhcN/YlaJ family sporulation lipoprotein [Bacillaceae]|nr:MULTISPECIES: YhcN/YlaJ family sporulation lipoprotein [Bacillaceae]
MRIVMTLLVAVSMLTACNQTSQQGMYQTNEAQQTARGTEYDSNLMERGYGFSRHTYEEMQHNNDQAGALVVNRDMLAEGISRMIVDNPAIEEAAVLVTDKYVLAVYDQQDNEKDNMVADQVKRTALSVVPSFYDVYVSNDPSHIKDIERYQNMTAGNADYASLLEDTIEELKQDPQGDVDLGMDEDMDIMRDKQKALREQQ